MRERTALHLRSLIAVAVLTIAGVVLIAGNTSDLRRTTMVQHAKPAISLATVRQ